MASLPSARPSFLLLLLSIFGEVALLGWWCRGNGFMGKKDVGFGRWNKMKKWRG
jgi:hypothetical protein